MKFTLKHTIFLYFLVAIFLSCEEPENKIGDGDGIALVDTTIAPVVDSDDVQVTMTDGKIITVSRRPAPVNVRDNPPECDANLYREIGSFTYVSKRMQADPSLDRAALRREIEERREELRNEFIEKIKNKEAPGATRITCKLTLTPDDIIYKPLRYAGSPSSNLSLTCDTNREGLRGQIVNPGTIDQLKDLNPIPMLSFAPDKCGVEETSPGTGQFVDEKGAMIASCDPVRDVEIKGCRITGRITFGSFGHNLHKLSMVRTDHVKRLRQSAAQHIYFHDLYIEGKFKGVFHFMPGVHHVTIENSEIHGGFHSMTIHLPSDGGWNIIKNNIITGQTKTWNDLDTYGWGKRREVISIDGSEHNRIVNNYFTWMPYGAISLYRNCGEKNTIRHRTPQYNQIINNIFDYDTTVADLGGSRNPTIMIGSRDDQSIKYSFGMGVKRYCHADELNGEKVEGNPERTAWDTRTVPTSSQSNSDWAENNVIADNQVIHLNVDNDWPYWFSSKARKLVNYFLNNEVEYERSRYTATNIQQSRGAGCAVLAGITEGMTDTTIPDLQNRYLARVRNGYLPYINNRVGIGYFWDIQPNVRLTCGDILQCNNNILSQGRSPGRCPIREVEFPADDAQACNSPNHVCAEGDNRGDSDRLSCPAGFSLLATQAACNLEYGRVNDSQRNTAFINRIKIVRESQNPDEGLCWVDDVKISTGQMIENLEHIYHRSTHNTVEYGCKEHDKNGGDCHVNVKLYCIPFGPLI